jgi:hypothetical protein
MYQFEREKTILAYDSAGLTFLLKPLMVLKAFNFNPIDNQTYLESPVVVDGATLGNVWSFTNSSFNEFSEENLRKRFIFHYMTDIPPTHRKLLSLADCAETLGGAGVRSLFYISPIDMETASMSVGPDFVAKVERNVALLRQSIESHGGECLDLSAFIEAKDFGWREDVYPNEHLSENGRARIAVRLAEWIRDDIQRHPDHYSGIAPLMHPLPGWDIPELLQIKAIAPPDSLKNQADVAYQLTLGPRQSIVRLDRTPISSGETCEASIYLWADNEVVLDDGNLVIQVARHGHAPLEHSNTRLTILQDTPTQVLARKTFEAEHEGVRILIGNESLRPITFNLAAPFLRRD